MREWRFWDWVAYATLFLAAAMEALEAGLKQAPKMAAKMPDILSAEWLSFLPFALVCLGTSILVCRAIFGESHRIVRGLPATISHTSNPESDYPSQTSRTFLYNPPDDFEWLSRGAQVVYGKLGKCRVRDVVDARGKNDDGITGPVVIRDADCAAVLVLAICPMNRLFVASCGG